MYKLIVGLITGAVATASLADAHTSSVKLHYLACDAGLLLVLLGAGWIAGLKSRRAAPAQGAARSGWTPLQRPGR